MKLYYFDIPGKAEAIRLLLHHAKVPFEDIRINFPDWPKYKETFEGKQVPVLEIDGKKHGQSWAILEYLGAKYGYLPTDPKNFYENSCIMSVCDDINDKLSNAFAPYSPYDEEAKKKLKEDIPKTVFPTFLAYIEKKLEAKTCKEFLVGCKYSVADFYFLGMISMMKLRVEGYKVFEAFPGIPLLKNYVEMRLKDFENYMKAKAPAPEKPKLYYFDGAGRGEMIRLLLRHAKVDFEDVRIKFADWPGMKEKFALKQVPVYECCGVQYPETDAIMHMLSLKHGYLPLDPEKMYKAIFVATTMKDLFEGFVRFTYGQLPEDKKKQLGDTYYSGTVPLIFSILEKRLKDNESQEYFVGSQYTMADFYVLGAAKWLIMSPQTEANFAKALDAAPTLKAYLNRRMADFKQPINHQ
eukprot:TRINITY_DN71137_c0_g1_i1.p2 TRINITY_DN71137_c0_g1~~TRINITY_DN71137_c0_g1_i1.p2  ORF type:complete len:410 (-),score=66.78 TRINITY_DN71137_c0_g1_i1:3485-4714(-)